MFKKKIAIHVRTGFKSVEAWIFTHWDKEFGIHRDPAKLSKWAVTDLATGMKVWDGSSSRYNAKLAAIKRLDSVGIKRYLQAVADSSSAPDPETVEPMALKAPVAEKKQVDVLAIAGLIAQHVPGGLSPTEVEAVARALSRSTGKLKSKCPQIYGKSTDIMAAAAWQGLQPNHFKFSTGRVFGIRGSENKEAIALFDKLFKVNWPVVLDTDAHELKKCGVWP